jgi:hypothetical protein
MVVALCLLIIYTNFLLYCLDLHQAVLSKDEMTIFQVSGVLESHNKYIRIVTAINHAGLELYFKAFHGTEEELAGGLRLPTEPDKLYKYLSKYQTELQEKKSKGEITENDYLVMFPPGKKETYSQEFSFPLFQTLIQMFSTKEIKEDDGNQSFVQQMVKLQELQGDKKLPKKLIDSMEKFQEKWQEVIEVLKTLKYDIGKIESLEKSDLDENNKFRFALLRSEVHTLLYESDECFKSVKMNRLALERLRGNFQTALLETKGENNNPKTTTELKELKNLTEELTKSENKIAFQKQQLLELVPSIKFWREKNIEGDVIICDENLSNLRDEINEQTRRVSELFNTVSFDIVYLKERAYSVAGEIKSVGLPS